MVHPGHKPRGVDRPPRALRREVGLQVQDARLLGCEDHPIRTAPVVGVHPVGGRRGLRLPPREGLEAGLGPAHPHRRVGLGEALLRVLHTQCKVADLDGVAIGVAVFGGRAAARAAREERQGQQARHWTVPGGLLPHSTRWRVGIESVSASQPRTCPATTQVIRWRRKPHQPTPAPRPVAAVCPDPSEAAPRPTSGVPRAGARLGAIGCGSLPHPGRLDAKRKSESPLHVHFSCGPRRESRSRTRRRTHRLRWDRRSRDADLHRGALAEGVHHGGGHLQGRGEAARLPRDRARRAPHHLRSGLERRWRWVEIEVVGEGRFRGCQRAGVREHPIRGRADRSRQGRKKQLGRHRQHPASRHKVRRSGRVVPRERRPPRR